MTQSDNRDISDISAPHQKHTYSSARPPPFSIRGIVFTTPYGMEASVHTGSLTSVP